MALRDFPKTRPGILKQVLVSNKFHSFFSLYRVFLSNNQCYVCNSVVPNKSEPQWECEALFCCSFVEGESCRYTCCKGQQLLCSAHSAATTTTLQITIGASQINVILCSHKITAQVHTNTCTHTPCVTRQR